METNNLTYSQKESYLIDVKGYSKSDFEDLGEIGIDNVLSNYDIAECLEYNS